MVPWKMFFYGASSNTRWGVGVIVGEIICVIIPTLNYQSGFVRLRGTSVGNARSEHQT